MAAEENEANGGGPGDEAEAPHPIYNWQSAIGATLAAIGLSVSAFLVLIDVFTPQATGYAGLALLVPMLLAAVGGVLIGTGWLRERRRQRRGERSSFFDQWVLDPFSFVQRTSPLLIVAAVAFLTLALFGTGAGSVAAVSFLESDTFCGSMCHEAMGPEALAHKQTAHSRVECVECHVGAGADGFLKAKIGGLRQLWAVATDTVERPIPTPIHGGTINRALCEGCHALEVASGYKALTRHYFLNGMEDIPVELTMLVKTGGSADEANGGKGIHYHMQIARAIEYIARDAQRQDIAWVRVTEADGTTREYSHAATPLTEEERASLEMRSMECTDCHSRPAHAFQSPIDLVNNAVASKRLPPDLAYVKEAAIRALDGGYADTDEAMEGIENTLREYFEEEDPDVLEEREEDVAQVIEDLQAIYKQTMFPEMKAYWSTHPDNSGHLDSAGCFRCHNDEMLDRDGEAMLTQCSSCHSILAQDDGAIQTMAEFEQGMGFVHPQDGGSFDEFSLCSDCHTGGKELYD